MKRYSKSKRLRRKRTQKKRRGGSKIVCNILDSYLVRADNKNNKSLSKKEKYLKISS
jgi:hypothetical protein